jgi:membrane-associated phospholipid phosphatase
LLFVFLVYKFKKKSIPIMLLALASIGMADGISSHILKPLVSRIRPCNLAELTNEIHLRIHCSGGFSFPSSHAANHFALAMFIGLALYKTNPWFLRIGLLWAGIISFAQVYVGVHFPVDIFSGMLLGCGIGLFLNFVLAKFKLSELYSKFF